MLDPRKPSFTPKKGKPSVVMFVGLQGQSSCHYVMSHAMVAAHLLEWRLADGFLVFFVQEDPELLKLDLLRSSLIWYVFDFVHSFFLYNKQATPLQQY